MVVVGYGQIIPQAISICRGTASSTCTRRCSRSIAAPRPSSGRSPMARRSPASPPCGSTPASTPATCCCRAETPIGAGRNRRSSWARGWPCMGADLLVETLARIDDIAPEKQDSSQATYAPILKKEDGRIDWSAIRAGRSTIGSVDLLPWPGCLHAFRGQTLHIWRSRVARMPLAWRPARSCAVRNRATAGRMRRRRARAPRSAAGRKKRIAARDFANGQRLPENEIWRHELKLPLGYRYSSVYAGHSATSRKTISASSSRVRLPRPPPSSRRTASRPRR